MEIRFAREDELDRVNELRKQVNDLHVEGKPDVFKAGFNDELYVYRGWLTYSIMGIIFLIC